MSVSARGLKGFRRRRFPGVSLAGPLLCVLVASLLTAWSAGLVRAAEGEEPPVFLIGPGDNLQITVWREPELSTSTVVRPDGRISVPLIEDLMAAGRTPTDLAEQIQDRLAEYVLDPLVTVTVVSGLGDLGQQVRVIGEAAEPRAVAYRSGMTLLDAVIAAGGLSRQADGNGAVILRERDGERSEIPVRLSDLVREGDPSANVALLPGDLIVIPEGFFSGEWRVVYRASASETLSDNIDQNPSGERDVGFITRGGPGISISGESARVVGALNGDLFLVHQGGGDDEGLSLDPSIAAASTTELSRDFLFFDLSAAVSRQVLDAREATSGSGASTSNRDLVATLSASPYIVHRIGDVANAEWRYRISPVIVDSGENSDVLSHEASLIVDSGDDFPFLGWTFSNFAGEEVRSDESDITTANTDLGVSYSVSQSVALLAGIGYEYRDGDEDEENNFQGLTWRGGFSYRPHPDLALDATYGRRNDSDSLDASLAYQITPKTSLRASYAEALETGQQRAISGLGGLIIDPDTGEIIDPVTGDPFDGNRDPFSFDDETTRTRTLRLAANHVTGRNVFGLSALRGTSEGGSEGDEEFYTARFSWARPLSTDLDFTAIASYDHSKFDEEDRTDDTVFLNLGLSYRLSSDVQALTSYSFQARESTDSDEEFYENSITFSILTTF